MPWPERCVGRPTGGLHGTGGIAPRKVGNAAQNLGRTARRARTQASADYHKRLDELKAKYKVAETRFGELRKAGGGKWETFQGDIESAWNDLEMAFRKLTH